MFNIADRVELDAYNYVKAIMECAGNEVLARDPLPFHSYPLDQEAEDGANIHAAHRHSDKQRRRDS